MRRVALCFATWSCSSDHVPAVAETTGTSTSTSTTETGTTTSESSSGADSSTGELACNGAAVLCDRRVDEVTFAATHNSIAAEDNEFPPINRNQTYGLRRQLDDGIRAMLLDVAEYEGDTWLCHGPCSLARVRHVDALAEIGGFLDEHPREVLVIIYEDTATVAAITADWETAGYANLPYTYDGTMWPTLGELVDAGTRVIVTAENGGPPPAWFHHVWDIAWDTPYTFHSLDELSCDANRGTAGVGLYLVNHWISTDADLPDEPSAAAANAIDVLGARANECRDQWQHPVNLLAVDFYEQGDLFAAVAEQNMTGR
jgi:hypothetical protein